MYFVYVLYSVDFNRHYIGMTDNYERRLLQHNNGLTSSTKSFIPWIIVLIEEFKSREKARLREKYLKSAAGRRWRKNNIIWPRACPTEVIQAGRN